MAGDYGGASSFDVLIDHGHVQKQTILQSDVDLLDFIHYMERTFVQERR